MVQEGNALPRKVYCESQLKIRLHYTRESGSHVLTGVITMYFRAIFSENPLQGAKVRNWEWETTGIEYHVTYAKDFSRSGWFIGQERRARRPCPCRLVTWPRSHLPLLLATATEHALSGCLSPVAPPCVACNVKWLANGRNKRMEGRKEEEEERKIGLTDRQRVTRLPQIQLGNSSSARRWRWGCGSDACHLHAFAPQLLPFELLRTG